MGGTQHANIWSVLVTSIPTPSFICQSIPAARGEKCGEHALMKEDVMKGPGACKFKHVCSICGGAHVKPKCPVRPKRYKNSVKEEVIWVRISSLLITVEAILI